MTDLELTRLCAKALYPEAEWIEFTMESGERAIVCCEPHPQAAMIFRLLHNAEQNEQLVSWLLREGYFFVTHENVFKVFDKLTSSTLGIWCLDTTPENRRRAVCEAVAKVMQEREAK